MRCIQLFLFIANSLIKILFFQSNYVNLQSGGVYKLQTGIN